MVRRLASSSGLLQLGVAQAEVHGHKVMYDDISADPQIAGVPERGFVIINLQGELQVVKSIVKPFNDWQQLRQRLRLESGILPIILVSACGLVVRCYCSLDHAAPPNLIVANDSRSASSISRVRSRRSRSMCWMMHCSAMWRSSS